MGRIALNLGRPFRVGDRWVTPSANEIDGVRIDSKAMEVLAVLAAAAPDVVSSKVLLDTIWPDVVVVDNVVYQAVAQLRKALCDDAHAPHYIETVTRRGYRLIAPVVREPREAAPARRRPRHNLPAQLTSFVGREQDVVQMGELLAAHRLVTVTGVGGCGKTRLALTVADALLDDFDDGVWLVEFAPVADPAQVDASVVKALGVDAPGESQRESLLSAVADKRLLLLMDNCEHVVGPCADLAEAMLRRAPGLRILATSREPLGIGGEHQWRIQSLATPDPRRLPPLDELGGTESVRLFVERAKSAHFAFDLSPENAFSVAYICSRLDGIPLAIELAAARVQTLSVSEIAVRLAESFQLLTLGGSRTALPRQQTLRATLDWSHALLGERERVLLSRLAVFANGFTLAAAERVCSADPLDVGVVVDLLTRLVEQSMVQLTGTVGGAARYRLLEPVRQYCQERLDERSEDAVTRDRHRDYFMAFAAKVARDRRVGGRSVGLFPRFEAESDNMDQALARCQDSDADNGLQMAANRYEVAATVGDWDPRWLNKLLARASDAAPARHSALFYLALPERDLPRRRERLDLALTLARRAGDRAVEARYSAELGNTLVAMGEVQLGRQMIESAVDLARATADANALGWCLLSVVWVVTPELRERALECIAAFRSSGNDVGLSIALYRFCSESLLATPQVDVPREWVEELLGLARTQGNTVFTAGALRCLALLAEKAGDPDGAARFFAQSADLLKQQQLAGRARYEQTRR